MTGSVGEPPAWIKDIRALLPAHVTLIAFNSHRGCVNSVEFFMEFHSNTYAFNVETVKNWVGRVSLELDEPILDADLYEPTYLVSTDELLPTQVREICARSFDELRDFLIEQEPIGD